MRPFIRGAGRDADPSDPTPHLLPAFAAARTQTCRSIAILPQAANSDHLTHQAVFDKSSVYISDRSCVEAKQLSFKDLCCMAIII